jgi:hypothetical protein
MYPVVWPLSHGQMPIEGDNGMRCVVNPPVTDLIVTADETG